MSSRPQTKEMPSRPATRPGTRASTRATSRFSTFTDHDERRSTSLDFVVLSEAEATRNYMSERKIPQMMDCLMSCLLMERPENHIEFLLAKLEAVQDVGPENVNWESFVRHLHPYRDPLRLDIIRDDSNYQIEHLKKLNKEVPSRSGEYKPDVFQLTEMEEPEQ